MRWMWGFAESVLSAFGLIFVAELGDKTQLVALGLGARHRFRIIAIGLTLGAATAMAAAAVLGGILGSTVPEAPLKVVAGLVFVAVAIFTLSDEGNESHESVQIVKSSVVVVSIALTIALAEMGDKSQVATVALAAHSNVAATWIGATLGEVSACLLGAFAGQLIGTRVSRPKIRIASAILFACVGTVLLASAL